MTFIEVLVTNLIYQTFGRQSPFNTIKAKKQIYNDKKSGLSDRPSELFYDFIMQTSIVGRTEVCPTYQSPKTSQSSFPCTNFALKLNAILFFTHFYVFSFSELSEEAQLTQLFFTFTENSLMLFLCMVRKCIVYLIEDLHPEYIKNS